MKKILTYERISLVLVVGMSLVMGYYLGYFIGESNINIEDKGLAIAYLLMAFSLSYYLQIIVHELGHYLFGRLTGYGFVSFRIGSFILYKSQGKYKFGRYSIPGTGGQCLLDPPELDKDGRYPTIIYNLGGGVINIIFSLILYFILKNFDLSNFGQLFCIFGLSIGFYFAGVNLIPLKMSGLGNDGMNALMLKKDKNSSMALWKQLRYNKFMTDGIRTKDMDESLFVVPEDGDVKNPLISTLRAMEVSRIVDQGDKSRSKKVLEEVVKEDILDIHKRGLELELAYIYLIEGDYAKAESLESKELDKYISKMKKYSPSIWRVFYAWELLKNRDEKKAEKVLTSFEKVSKTYLYKGEVQADREALQEVDRIYRQVQMEV